MSRSIKAVVFSTLYPSSARPLHGVFVETRLRELLRTREVQAKVVAPVPWFWSTHERHGRYAEMAVTPRREDHNGIDVLHPRFVALPKVGMTLAPLLLALGARPALAQLQREGFDFDLIDAHYYYPDGVAAALLSSWFGKPMCVTARGTDVNLIPQHWLPRRFIRWAGARAAASIGVSAALVQRLRDLGFDPARLHLMRNGVDCDRFQPLDKLRMRAELGLPAGPVVLTVGNLHEHKGQRLALEAHALLLERWPDAHLAIIGQGPDRALLEQRAAAAGMADRVTFAGTVPNADMSRWYSAADVLVLASSREGWPNVLLEAMACGLPVVASAVGGVPEIVQHEGVGRVVGERNPRAFADAVAALLVQCPKAADVRRYAQQFSWQQTSQDQLRLFESMVSA